MIKIKKEIFIVFAILIVIIGADIGLEKFTQKNFDEISEQLDLLENKILSENKNIINNEKNNEENFDKNIVKSYINKNALKSCIIHRIIEFYLGKIHNSQI